MFSPDFVFGLVFVLAAIAGVIGALFVKKKGWDCPPFPIGFVVFAILGIAGSALVHSAITVVPHHSLLLHQIEGQTKVKAVIF